MQIIHTILQTELFVNQPPVLVDIGASGEINQKWKLIAPSSICIAFDADDREFNISEQTNKNYKKLITFNRIVTAQPVEKTTFYLTRSPFCSSLLEPDNTRLQPWVFNPLFEVADKKELPAITIPSALQQIQLDYIDWFKTDTQGTDLRLFKTLPAQLASTILAAEFEPGIIDAYKGEDKLFSIIEYMQVQGFWLSSMDLKGTQRLSTQYQHKIGAVTINRVLRKSPCWAEITYLRGVATNTRQLLLLYIFALLEKQYGFALEIAHLGLQQTKDSIFDKCIKAVYDKLSRDKWKIPFAIAKDSSTNFFPTLMTNLCTLFNSNYLARGLALYESLQSTGAPFHLYIVAFDDNCYEYLRNANLPGITPISLKEFEDPELLKIKPSRSAAEYCWTCTASIIRYCIQHYNLPSCTYIDADMIFYHDPAVVIAEAGNNSVLITEHRYSKAYNQAEKNGIYCVQFMYFKNTEEGMKVLNWWRDRCLEWCYARLEDGKFGDQKYLDDWTTRFTGVYVSQHIGAGIAPWNVQQYHFRQQDNQLLVSDGKKEVPVVFFHFHGLKFYTDKVSCTGSLYELSKEVKKQFYFPYIQKLCSIENGLRQQGILLNSNGASGTAPERNKVYTQFLKERISLLKKRSISPFQVKQFNFNHHYHYHYLNLFQ